MPMFMFNISSEVGDEYNNFVRSLTKSLTQAGCAVATSKEDQEAWVTIFGTPTKSSGCKGYRPGSGMVKVDRTDRESLQLVTRVVRETLLGHFPQEVPFIHVMNMVSGETRAALAEA